MALVDSARLPAAGWLRNRDFDLVLICGITALALAAGGVIALMPAALALILLADAWLLGYPHVAATFVRLAPDKSGLQKHRFLIFGLPFIVVAATTGLAIGFGIALIATIYFYWQWYHTLRQSWGVAQLYRRRSQVAVREHPLFAEGLFALVALWGLLHRLTTAQDYFIYPSLPIIVPHVPIWLADGVGVLAVAGLAWWGISRAREWLRGELPVAHTLFSASHYLIFIVGYVIMDNVAGGWVVTNIWHTAQYLMLVWMFNENVATKATPDKGWFFELTQNRALLYFALCLVAAFPIYFAINSAMVWGTTALFVALVANQTINFHHFIVDAIVWRQKRKPAGAPA
jgi:MFS family permease